MIFLHKTPRCIVEIIKDMNRRIDHLSNLQEQDQQKLDTLKAEQGYFNSNHATSLWLTILNQNFSSFPFSLTYLKISVFLLSILSDLMMEYT